MIVIFQNRNQENKSSIDFRSEVLDPTKLLISQRTLWYHNRSLIFYIEQFIMVSDQELYELIKKAVRQRKIVPHHENENFAERYCDQQLTKKKLKGYHNHQKMDYIMKNFSKVDTYFDLPQLLNSIHNLKIKKETDMMALSCKAQDKIPRITEKHPISRYFSDFKNLRYVFENQDIQQMLAQVQNDNEWKSENLKNNSSYNLDNLFSHVQDEKENETLKQDAFKIFDLLHKFKDNQRGFLHKEKQDQIKKTSLNYEKKKQYTKFLHKVSSFLQIILETQHRSKWKQYHKSRSSFVKKNLHSFASVYDRKVKVKQNSPKKVTFKPNLSHTHCVQLLRQQTRKIKQNQRQNQDSKSNIVTSQNSKSHYASRFFTEGFNKQKIDKQVSFVGDQKSDIRKNFTFKRRSIKQKIINKLDKFIGEIDDQSHSSLKQNTYYNKQINKLEVQFKHLYGRYKRETLAGEKDIADLKQLASQFTTQHSTKGSNSGQGVEDEVLASQTEVIRVTQSNK